MKGIQQCRTNYGSLDNTVITIEAGECRSPLAEHIEIANEYNGKKSTFKSCASSESYAGGSSSNHSNDSYFSHLSTKSFKSHFIETKVLAFALLLAIALSIGIYLLAIESRLPSVTLSLDLVSHNFWSLKLIPKSYRLQPKNVDHVILMQTGNRTCDTSCECLKILQEMQDLNQSEELPYNFLIGGDGRTYEVRGWEYPSSLKGVPQERSLVIGLVGIFDYTAPKKDLLRTAQSLINESLKRHMINHDYHIYGLRLKDDDHKEGQLLFNELMKWSKFKGFISKS